MGTPIFLKHATYKHLETLGRYIRSLELSNEYANVSRILSLQNSDTDAQDRWAAGLKGVWQKDIEKCEQCINEVTAL